MTRLLAFGDLHLGAGTDYGREPGDRLRDQQDVLAMIVQLANDSDVDAVLFAGDAFHRRRPTPAELLAFARPLCDLEAPLVAISGNHDVESADLPTALEVFTNDATHDSPGLLTLSTRPEIVTVAGVAVVTLPWTPVSRLVAAHGGGDRDDTHEEAAAMLVAAARGLRAEIPAETPAVLLAHWSVTGASTPTGALTDEFREVVLPIEELEQLGFDAIVCGHIHKAQLLGSVMNPVTPTGDDAEAPFLNWPAFYTGSPAPVDFGEADTPHGVWLLEIGAETPLAPTATSTALEFVPIESRPFVTVDVDLTTDRHEDIGVDETDAVAAAIATRLPLDDAVIRVRYRATEAQAARIDWPRLRPLLADAHRVYGIVGDIVRADRARVDGVDEDLAPLDAVDAWCDAYAVDDRQPLRDISARYLEEVRG